MVLVRGVLVEVDVDPVDLAVNSLSPGRRILGA
jgi:hypothetical protein